MSETYISADKLYKIIHCSKRKTKYLLDNGIIPCEDTGKKTWRYRVKMSDVKTYLNNISKNKSWYYIPAGIFSSVGESTEKAKTTVTMGEQNRICKIARLHLDDVADALSVSEAAKATGYSTTFISTAIKKGELYADKIGSVHIIPKGKLIRFLSSKTGLMIRYKSDFHKEIIKEFNKKQFFSNAIQTIHLCSIKIMDE